MKDIRDREEEDRDRERDRENGTNGGDKRKASDDSGKDPTNASTGEETPPPPAHDDLDTAE